jgi:uncharacterized protein YecE (DUF72 family)
MPRAGRVLIGTSGYVYPHWRRRFYSPHLPARDWLPFYAERFATVELNSPFYRLPSAEVFAGWRDAAPPGFVFAVKASRFLTHIKRLREPAAPLRLFLERARALGDALGPVLFQLPSRFHADVARLDGFLAALGRQRQATGLRAVLEVRHPSWLIPEVFVRLRRANVALCLHDWRELAVEAPLTADFVYVRRHGPGRRGGGRYSAAHLRHDATRVAEWRRAGRDVYAYFNNDARAFALADAVDLTRRVGARAVATDRRHGRSA